MPPHRTALITGASSGIGRAYAEEYAAHHNKDLILVARSGEVLREMKQSLSAQHGCRVEVIVADLTAPNAVRSIVEQVEAFGMSVDVLVNNAGFGSIGSFVDLDLDAVERMVTLNCTAVASLCRAFVPHMVEQRFGSVLNVASVAALAPMPYMALYSATKAFVLNFSRALRGEVRPYGLRVVALCPGPVATGFLDHAAGHEAPANLVPDHALTPMSEVVQAGLTALRKNRDAVIPGKTAPLAGFALKAMPTRGFAAVARRRLGITI